MDRISDLPDHLISLILEKLHIEDAARTSALSTSWRFRWTSLTSLKLDSYFDDFENPSQSASIMSSIVLQNSGCLKKFHMYKPGHNDDRQSCLLFQQAVDHVMKCNTLESLSLETIDDMGSMGNLPSSVFSGVNLRHLEICYFRFDLPSWLEEFSNLKCLVLDRTITSIDTVSEFVSICPLLEEIQLKSVDFNDVDPDDPDDDRTLHLDAPNLTHLLVEECYSCAIYVSVSDGQNLESVCLSFDEEDVVEHVSIYFDKFEFFNYSTLLQRVSFDGYFLKCLGKCKVIHTLPRFGQMKIMDFHGIGHLDLSDPAVLQSILSFCACSPNIRDLRIQCIDSEVSELHVLESMAEKYINIDFEHLARVEMCAFIYVSRVEFRMIELKMIELFLRFSPGLEVMNVRLNDKRIEKVITNFYRASTKVKFDFSDW